MPIFLLHFFSHWLSIGDLLTSQQSSFSCLFNQSTLTTYFLWNEDQINRSCTEEKKFNPFHLFTITQKQTFTFLHFEDGCHFQDGCNEETSCVFVFPFLHWPFSSTQILVFLNIHFAILTWNMEYLLCRSTFFARFPQLVNFHQIMLIMSLLPVFFYFLFFNDLFLAQFCKVFVFLAWYI